MYASVYLLTVQNCSFDFGLIWLLLNPCIIIILLLQRPSIRIGVNFNKGEFCTSSPSSSFSWNQAMELISSGQE